jgi:hypothetical protein
MKKLIILILLFPNIFFSQEEFSFELYFEDALGNKDTLVLGYDPLATDSIDVAFGEVNIINQPWNSVFEVRTANDDFFQDLFFMLKKDVRNHDNVIPILIKKPDDYLKITWDAIPFQNNQTILGSAFMNDVGTISHLSLDSEYIIDSSNSFMFPNHHINGQSLNLIYLHFSEGFVSIEENQNKYLQIFPNPTSSVLNVEVSEEFLGGELKIFDILGNQVWIETIKSNRFAIDNFANLTEGVYTILLSKDEYFETQKVVKQ